MIQRTLPSLKVVLALIFGLLLIASSGTANDLKNKSWEEIVRAAEGQTVDWYMWGGSPAVNRYVNGYVAEQVKERYGITLRQVPVKDIAEVVSKLMVEKQEKKQSRGQVDLMWINGENFRTCKQYGLLYGPFSHRLPNQRLVDWSKPSIFYDFGTAVDGLESPWGSAQMVMIYDSARVPNPPRTLTDLLAWIRKYPGRFTYPAPPDFTGSVFIRHLFYHIAGNVEKWQGKYSEADLKSAAEATFMLLNDLRSSLWRQGATYPESPVRLNSLFADGEIDFTFSYHQAEASRNILDGLFPPTTRSYVFDEGTIANTHFVAIPFNAEDKAAAMVVADFLLSPEAQLEKATPDVWGDFPVLDQVRLTEEQRRKFAELPRGPATLTGEELSRHQLPEPPSDILVYLEKGWKKNVLKKRK